MASEKKCPTCGKWTVWNQDKEDLCTHCGVLLSDFEQKKEERGEKIRTAPAGIFPVKHNEPLFLKWGKYTINTAHLIFTAVMSFIVWLITFVAA
jgi:uncharacterized membrane protein YvbJ